ncbi:tRNA lysidine(34) synthetase TilS [Mesobacillus subterraneus]|uniref:tRNA lysidine(34) synthetase TilS n=1 Tax=Mesobacillus subterraneus TaxID=285983 RepID=UPI00273D9E3E|nr:tRNA lysidine(34) synthetase TilS [Mesobacillus subterraneus]WLR55079.1 tRNA lysidine(34) synthetase TilS [Mesobacillus subterraneus]
MIEQKVNAFLERHDFQLNNMSIAVGVSGGPDSLALLHFLSSLRERNSLKIVAVHVDHMFRGEESYQDALFVKDFCGQRDIPFEMKRTDVPAYMRETGLSSQQAARECRYSFFEQMMEKHQLQYLALGHHGDDQVETVLMRLTRGSSGKARAGMPFSRGIGPFTIFRPFLCLSKEELKEYCSVKSLKPRIDPSNEKTYYSRNRFRKSVLPFLKEENPAVHEHFQRFSEELQMDEEYLIELTSEELNKVMKKEDKRITISISSFQEMPMPLQRRGIKLILNYLYNDRPASLSAIHIEKIFSIIRNPHPSGTLDFPSGLRIIRSYGNCHFELNPPERQSYHFELSEPDQLRLPNGGVIDAQLLNGAHERKVSNDCFIVDLEQTGTPLIIRTRRNGDRISLKGMTGSKKVKDIFIDMKIPLAQRNEWPIVTDMEGRILWLPGMKKSNHESTEGNRLLLLTYIKY